MREYLVVTTRIEDACDRLATAIEDVVVGHHVGTAEGMAQRKMALSNAIMALVVEVLRG